MSQPKALRLADALDRWYEGWFPEEAAAELRRLHALNGELLEALKNFVDVDHYTERERLAKARAAIAKAEAQP
jgi:hypothetical protein